MAEDFSTWAHIVAAILVHWTVDASRTKEFNCVVIHEWWYDKAQRSLNLGKILDFGPGDLAKAFMNKHMRAAVMAVCGKKGGMNSGMVRFAADQFVRGGPPEYRLCVDVPVHADRQEILRMQLGLGKESDDTLRGALQQRIEEDARERHQNHAHANEAKAAAEAAQRTRQKTRSGAGFGADAAILRVSFMTCTHGIARSAS